MEGPEAKLELILKYFGDFTPLQLEQLSTLDAVYREWNERINVISRKDIDALYERHVLHSLSIAAWIPFGAGLQVIDIGTGGGFPGIPLAIFFPETEFLLADSIGKKLKVVEAVADALGLKNVTTLHSRAEDIRDRRFHFAVSRAVAPLKDLWRWSRPLLNREQGMKGYRNGLICLKGGDLAAEISESRLHPRVRAVNELFPDEPWFAEKYMLYVPT